MANFLRNALFAAGFMAIGASTTVVMAAAAGRGMGPGMGQGAGFAQIIEDLDLTEAQQDELEALHDDVRAFRQQRMQERGQGMHKLIELLGDDALDREAVHEEIDQQADARLRSVHAMADRVMDLRDSLTPEQRATIADRIDAFAASRGQGMRQGMGRSQGMGRGMGNCRRCDDDE